MDPKEFNDHMWNFTNYGIVNVAINFGNEVGLFDVLMKDNNPMTSEEIAEKLNMKERYVREWLGCMVAAKIVSLDVDKYYIPKEYNDIIKASSSWGYAAIAWMKRFEQTKACFQKNGPWGNDYDADDTFWTFFGGFRDKTGDNFLDELMLPALESLSDFQGKLESGIEVLDLGCGTGVFAILMAQRFPKSHIIGLDPCERPLKIANKHAQGLALPNLEFIKGGYQDLGKESPGKYDLILMIDMIHDLPDPRDALVEVEKALKPTGKVLILEFRPHSKQADNAGDVVAAMFYGCSIFSCLQCSMQDTGPKIGYGTCWGWEEMTKTIKEVLKLEKTVDLPLLHAIYICSKN